MPQWPSPRNTTQKPSRRVRQTDLTTPRIGQSTAGGLVNASGIDTAVNPAATGDTAAAARTHIPAPVRDLEASGQDPTPPPPAIRKTAAGGEGRRDRLIGTGTDRPRGNIWGRGATGGTVGKGQSMSRGRTVRRGGTTSPSTPRSLGIARTGTGKGRSKGRTTGRTIGRRTERRTGISHNRKTSIKAKKKGRKFTSPSVGTIIGKKNISSNNNKQRVLSTK